MNPTSVTAAALGCELAGEVVQRFGRVRVRVTGTSMIPAVWPGDVLVVERRAASEISNGEIALAGREGRLLAHRLIDAGANSSSGFATADRVLTRGDSQRGLVAPLAAREVLGAVIAVERGREVIAPRRQLKFCERALAALARNSSFAAGVLVRLHRFYCND
jgi:signal peptidase I